MTRGEHGLGRVGAPALRHIRQQAADDVPLMARATAQRVSTFHIMSTCVARRLNSSMSSRTEP